MKKIDKLTVCVTYTVCLSNVEVSDSVFQGLISRGELDPNDCDLDANERNALEWLADNITEHDAVDLNYDVDID